MYQAFETDVMDDLFYDQVEEFLPNGATITIATMPG